MIFFFKSIQLTIFKYYNNWRKRNLFQFDFMLLILSFLISFISAILRRPKQRIQKNTVDPTCCLLFNTLYGAGIVTITEFIRTSIQRMAVINYSSRLCDETQRALFIIGRNQLQLFLLYSSTIPLRQPLSPLKALSAPTVFPILSLFRPVWEMITFAEKYN